MDISTLNAATIRYRDAGLCDESQRSILSATLRQDVASIAALNSAIAARTPLTLAQYDGLVDSDVEVGDSTRYGVAFGDFDPRINDFGMMDHEVAEVIARALARGTPMTETEIVWLGRNVGPGLLY